MFSLLWHGKLTWSIHIEKPRPALSRQVLFANLLLQCHQRLQQRLRPGRAPRNMHIDRNVPVTIPFSTL